MPEYAIRPVAPYDLAASARGLGDGTRRFRDGALALAFRAGTVLVRQRGDGTLLVTAPDDEAFERARWVLGADVDQGDRARVAGIVAGITTDAMSLGGVGDAFGRDGIPDPAAAVALTQAWSPYRMWVMTLLHVRSRGR